MYIICSGVIFVNLQVAHSASIAHCGVASTEHPKGALGCRQEGQLLGHRVRPQKMANMKNSFRQQLNSCTNSEGPRLVGSRKEAPGLVAPVGTVLVDLQHLVLALRLSIRRGGGEGSKAAKQQSRTMLCPTAGSPPEWPNHGGGIGIALVRQDALHGCDLGVVRVLLLQLLPTGVDVPKEESAFQYDQGTGAGLEVLIGTIEDGGFGVRSATGIQTLARSQTV